MNRALLLFVLLVTLAYAGLVSAFGEKNQKRSPCSEDELSQLKQLQDLFYTSCTSGVSGECKSNLQNYLNKLESCHSMSSEQLAEFNQWLKALRAQDAL